MIVTRAREHKPRFGGAFLCHHEAHEDTKGVKGVCITEGIEDTEKLREEGQDVTSAAHHILSLLRTSSRGARRRGDRVGIPSSATQKIAALRSQCQPYQSSPSLLTSPPSCKSPWPSPCPLCSPWSKKPSPGLPAWRSRGPATWSRRGQSSPGRGLSCRSPRTG